MKKQFSLLSIIFIINSHIYSDVIIQNDSQQTLKASLLSENKEAFQTLKDSKELTPNEKFEIKNDYIKEIQIQFEEKGKWINAKMNPSIIQCKINPNNGNELENTEANFFGYKKISIQFDNDSKIAKLICSND